MILYSSLTPWPSAQNSLTPWPPLHFLQKQPHPLAPSPFFAENGEGGASEASGGEDDERGGERSERG